jgi:hypothetical protein
MEAPGIGRHGRLKGATMFKPIEVEHNEWHQVVVSNPEQQFSDIVLSIDEARDFAEQLSRHALWAEIEKNR